MPSKNMSKKVGGDIKKHAVYKDIISIGYELETSGLAKLISQPDDEGEKTVLLNTDSARDDVSRLISGDFSDIREDEEESYDLRINEASSLVIDAYDDNGKIDKTVHFVAANDISETNFVKNTNLMCRALLGKNIEKSPSLSDSSSSSKSKSKPYTGDDIEKDQLFKFRMIEPSASSSNPPAKSGSKKGVLSLKRQSSLGEKEYDIHFVFWGSDIECGVFSDMEWVATYYKPKQRNDNIILDTFTNLARNLIRHLDDFVPIPGNVVLTDGHTDFVIDKPETRILFHKPGTNLNYLQTHVSRVLDKKTLTLDDVCVTPQMTFASHISKVFPVAKTLIKDTIRSIVSHAKTFDQTLNILDKVETCVKKLIRSYNSNAPKPLRIVEGNKNRVVVKEIHHLLMLMFYKLYIYINLYDPKGEAYFKDYLIVNVRHSNYILYKELKKALATLFLQQLPSGSQESTNDAAVIGIVRDIIVQESILKECMLRDDGFIRKNAFHPSNRMPKESPMYGNPLKSMVSYLDFFENPIEKDNVEYDRQGNITTKILFHDWLEYKQIDKYSAKMPLNNGVILIEFRAFSSAIISYLYSIKDQWIQDNMTQGTCNILMNTFSPALRKVAIGVLRRFVELSDAKRLKRGSVVRSSSKKTAKKRR